MPTPARQLYIISDLHLGGIYQTSGRGFRLCTHADALAGFVDGLTRKPLTNPRVELVINGDMIDFLAEENAEGTKWTPFTADENLAVKKFSDIAGRDGQFFGALKNFLAKGHRLVILLGNHDLEMCLPRVRRQLEAILGVNGQSDFEFIYDGEAYVVGNALIEHGNRYDKFNVVDYDGLRRVRSLLSRQQAVPAKYAFNPPAGSKMVSDVINPIKESYRFVDMLKPESGAVVPLLLALEPKYREIITRVVQHAMEAAKHNMAAPALPGFGGDIHADPASGGGDFGSDISTFEAAPSPAAALDRLLQEELGSDVAAFKQGAQLGGAGSSNIGSDISTYDTVLGFAGLLLSGNSASLQQRVPALLKAMRALENDQTFNETLEPATEYRDAAADLARDKFKFVVFGHTHHPKDVDLGGGARYLNSGTWADVLRFPQEIIQGDEQSARTKVLEFAQAMKTGDFSRWTLFRPSYVRLDVDATDQVQTAELVHYDPARANA